MHATSVHVQRHQHPLICSTCLCSKILRVPNMFMTQFHHIQLFCVSNITGSCHPSSAINVALAKLNLSSLLRCLCEGEHNSVQVCISQRSAQVLYIMAGPTKGLLLACVLQLLILTHMHLARRYTGRQQI